MTMNLEPHNQVLTAAKFAHTNPDDVRRPETSNLKLENLNFPRPRGLSLIEIMVTVALLTVIILGLVAMFDQTRKAFSSGLANVDYQDSGRVAMDMIAREIQQMSPVNYSNGVNFYLDVPTAFNTKTWPLAAGDVMVPTLQRLFFVTRYNQTLGVIGYRLDDGGVSSNVGTLYRYGTNGISPGQVNGLVTDFISNTPVLPLNRVIDGVVSFRARAYDRIGNEIQMNAAITNFNPNFAAVYYPASGDYGYALSSNAVPAYVELELGVMESRTLARYRALGTANQATFLTNHAGQVHIFKQRVTIPGVDRSAYP